MSAPPPAPRTRFRHLQRSDLRSAARLSTEAVAAVTGIVEGVHQSVWRSLGFPSGRHREQTRGLTGLVYRTIQGVNRWVGRGLERGLARLEPWLADADGEAAETPERAAFVAALNGVLGDHLLASGNPLATPMSFRRGGAELATPSELGAKVLLLIHGLCRNDLQWQDADGKGLGEPLAEAIGAAPLYLRYNTGRHVSENGRELAQRLEELVREGGIEELAVVAHSMGGLLIRSACHYAQEAGLGWPQRLHQIVFLGTPHHGAPLERAGNGIDVVLGAAPYTKPLARLGKLRSAGITDLRHGFLVDEDWAGRDRFARAPDRRRHLPLPTGVACFAVAATTGDERTVLAERLVGDGLVPLRSALGLHHDPARTLDFPAEATWIAYRTHHLQLLRSPEVSERVVGWLAPRPSVPPAPQEPHDG